MQSPLFGSTRCALPGHGDRVRFIFVDDSFAGKFSLSKGPNILRDFVFQEAVENGEDKGIFSKQDSAAGFFVQSVDDGKQVCPT